MHESVHVPGPYGFAKLPGVPKSHCSGPFITLSPQYPASLQSDLHVPYVPLLTPSSHSSPVSFTPLPHLKRQCVSQVLADAAVRRAVVALLGRLLGPVAA